MEKTDRSLHGWAQSAAGWRPTKQALALTTRPAANATSRRPAVSADSARKLACWLAVTDGRAVEEFDGERECLREQRDRICGRFGGARLVSGEAEVLTVGEHIVIVQRARAMPRQTTASSS